MATRRGPANQRGVGLVQIVIGLAIVALGGFLAARYVGSTARTVETLQQERPLGNARMTADRATVMAIQDVVRAYQVEHGRWPQDRAAVLALLPGPPRFQCAGNDVEYEPATGALKLVITDPGRC